MFLCVAKKVVLNFSFMQFQGSHVPMKVYFCTAFLFVWRRGVLCNISQMNVLFSMLFVGFFPPGNIVLSMRQCRYKIICRFVCLHVCKMTVIKGWFLKVFFTISINLKFKSLAGDPFCGLFQMLWVQALLVFYLSIRIVCDFQFAFTGTQMHLCDPLSVYCTQQYYTLIIFFRPSTRPFVLQ